MVRNRICETMIERTCLNSNSAMILQLALNRLTIHKHKKIELGMTHKREVGNLLEQGKQAQARVLVLHMHRLLGK